MKPSYQNSANRKFTPVRGNALIAFIPHVCGAAARRSPGT